MLAAVGFVRHPCAISSAFGSTQPNAAGIIIRVSGVRVPPPACGPVASFDSGKREDDEIRGTALQFLTWDVEVPSDSIDVKVQDGWVTLKGDVSYQFESDAAYDDVASM
jgi:hypothetical protein